MTIVTSAAVGTVQTGGTTTVFSAPRQLSDQNTQGTVLGASKTDLIGFFGDTNPIAQPGIGPGNAFGTIFDTGVFTKYQVLNATSAVAATTTLEVTSTVTGIQAADVIALNNGNTIQAGIGVAGYRVSAANTIGINYSNISAGSLNPTQTAAYDVLAVSSNYTTTAVLSPTAVAATPGNTTWEQTFSVPGATVGSFPIVNKPTSQAGLGITNVRVVSAGQVAIQFVNNSSGAITPTANETYSFAFLPNLTPVDRTLVYRYLLPATAVAASSAAQSTTTVTGILATDVAYGGQKGSAQAGLGIAGYAVTAANTVGTNFINVSSAVTTTAEVDTVIVERLQAKGPFQMTSVTLTPVSVAATTTAEQTFTVPFLLNASTSVLVTKPSLTPGISIVNARVSAASTLAITYQNNNTSAVIPTSETYQIGYCPLQGPGATTLATSQSVSQAFSGQTLSVQDIRAILLNLNMNAAV